MCGIAGYYSPKQTFTDQDIKRMTDTISHRGPDAEGFYSDHNVGLGHRRLSIIDLSAAANQPMFTADGRYSIIFNGEIFNYREIASEVKAQLKTHSDTEVIMNLIAEKGPEVVSTFNGMFAIAFYDRIKGELLLFRDRMGVKPLFYYRNNEDIVFASEIKALKSLKRISDNAQTNQKAIAQFLHIGYIAEPHTIYSNIFKFPAGAYARISSAGMEIRYYWKTEEQIEHKTVTDLLTAKTEFRSLMQNAVELRMISDVPFGTFLSGGVDSSLVTALAQNISVDPVKTFSIGFKESKFNESEYAKKVSRHLHTEHYEFIVTYKDAIDLANTIIDVYDEPFADPSAIPTMIVSKLARQYVTMTLSGDGGDELFHGYGMYTWAKRLSNPFVAAARKPAALLLSTMPYRYRRAGFVLNYPSKEKIRNHIFSQEQYFFSEKEIDTLLTNKQKENYFLKEDMGVLKRKLSAKEAQAVFDINHYLKDDLLVKVDRASMKYSLETRTPFLDYRVVSFALNLSENLKIKNGVTKYLAKEVLYDLVPKEYFNRPKWGFSIPLSSWLTDELRPLLEESLDEKSVEAAGVVNAREVSTLKKRFLNGEKYLYNRMWNLIMLHQWLNKNK